jgi:hypothetical protein
MNETDADSDDWGNIIFVNAPYLTQTLFQN